MEALHPANIQTAKNYLMNDAELRQFGTWDFTSVLTQSLLSSKKEKSKFSARFAETVREHDEMLKAKALAEGDSGEQEDDNEPEPIDRPSSGVDTSTLPVERSNTKGTILTRQLPFALYYSNPPFFR